MTTNQTEQNKVLCLSGGGVKGIAELVVLAKIEEITQQPISKLFNRPLSKLVNVVQNYKCQRSN